MFDVSSFLLRWIFLSNLCRDVAEIQSLPSCQPYHPHPQQQYPEYPVDPIIPHSSALNLHPDQQLLHHSQGQHQHPEQHQHRHPVPQQQHYTHYNQHPIDEEAAWKEQCLRGILSYPPGIQRAMVMDALRLELVQQLTHKLREDDDSMARYSKLQAEREYRRRHQQKKPTEEDSDSDPYVDADLEIVNTIEREVDRNAAVDGTGVILGNDENIRSIDSVAESTEPHLASLVIEQDGATNVVDDLTSEGTAVVGGRGDSSEQGQIEDAAPKRPKIAAHSEKDVDTSQQQQLDPPLLAKVLEAKRSLLLVRNYLPQLVSAVLKSPPAFDEHQANPIQGLRTLILSRCLNDPSVGIELCWLLEAEVGRAWKTLFEHRQQTGRRLIIVLPAEKAAVLAKIGTEKRESFDLLQDAEQATAYGYTSNLLDRHPQQQQYYHDHHHSQTGIHDEGYLGAYHTRLPSSLSLRRCSHFGDTMHFIDRLTRISSDLRMIPNQNRYDVLCDSLLELNRRIRRRMVTHGDVSLDVEDNRSAYDWPQIQDMSLDMIKYSVHLPLIPQRGTWPDGEVSTPEINIGHTSAYSDPLIPNTEVVRVLSIVVPETKLLASRERCPFLVHLEVADSGLDGSDARLYTTGATGLGATVGEALGITSAGAASAAASSRRVPFMNTNELPAYGIPDELLLQSNHFKKRNHNYPISNTRILAGTVHDESNYEEAIGKPFLRGGGQAERYYYENHDVSGTYMVDPFDHVRQQEYEQLHHQLHAQRTATAYPPSHLPCVSKVSLGAALLDNVFGREWIEKCKEIRNASPYGHLKGWRLASFIMKAGEDIRREAFVMQIISKLQAWFQDEIPKEHRPFMRPYTIMCVGGDAGLLECLSDAKSVDEVKKRTDGFTTLRDYFERAYGPPRPHRHVQQTGSHYGHVVSPPIAFGLPQVAAGKQGIVSFETAQLNFLRSLVGYSLVCFILQIKDRHNANILLDRVGHIMHIDFGYVLGDTPKMGKVPIFSERAPFKLSAEFWEVLGGWNVNGGGLGVKFCKMFELAFACASSHADEIAALTEAAMLSLDSNPRAARATSNSVRSRLRMRGPPGSREQKVFIMELVNAALTSWGTSTYDWLQRSMNGYQ